MEALEGLTDVLGVDETAPIVSLLPNLLIGVIFGLAMDDEVFLVSGMREACVHGAGPTEATVTGFCHGARVVTAAAIIIMISVFAGFLLDDIAQVKSIGMGLATAVLFDASVIRTTLVPAVMTLLRAQAWALPRRLDRLLPRSTWKARSCVRYWPDTTSSPASPPRTNQEPTPPAPFG